jgi:hypothetical protein
MVKSFSVGVSSSGFFLTCQGCLGKRRDIPQGETGSDQTQLGMIIVGNRIRSEMRKCLRVLAARRARVVHGHLPPQE